MSQLKINELEFIELMPINRDDLRTVVGGVSSFDVDFDVDFDADLAVKRSGDETVIFKGVSFARADALSFGGKARARARARQRRS